MQRRSESALVAPVVGGDLVRGHHFRRPNEPQLGHADGLFWELLYPGIIFTC